MGILARTSERASMSPLRVVVALVLCGLIVLSQLLQTIFERDDWPLSSFPMYSWKQPPVVTQFELVGVTAEGEEKLTPQHTAPLTNARLRALLNANVKTTAATLVPAVCKNLAILGGPDLSAIRVYRKAWKINRQLKGLHTRGDLHTTLPLLCPKQKEAIEAQKDHPPQAIAAPPGSVILEAEALELKGEARIVKDARAHEGKAVSLSGDDSTDEPLAVPASSIVAHFQLEAGKYHVWLRSKAVKGAKEQSVWLQVNDDVGTERAIELSNLATPAPKYPVDAYAWTSKKSGHAPVEVEFDESGNQTLVISKRQGSPVIDQVLLTRGWPHHPVHNLPIRL